MFLFDEISLCNQFKKIKISKQCDNCKVIETLDIEIEYKIKSSIYCFVCYINNIFNNK